MTVVYKPSEVMDMLGLKESTYKKYILELEKEGYIVQKDGRTRLFTEGDIKTLEQFMELLKYDGITITLAAKKIVEIKGKTVITAEPESHDVMTLVEMAVSTALGKQEERFSQVLKEQAEFNKQLMERLDQQQKYIEERLEKRDQVLIESLKDSLEHQKQIAAALEAQEQERQKRGFWSRLFKKGLFLMEEHVFLENEDILVSSTRLVVDGKTIVMSSVCSIEMNKEEVSPPWLLIGLTLFALMVALISPFFSGIGWVLFLIFAVITLFVWLLRKRKEGLVIELNSGEKTYIDNSEVDDLESVFKALNDVIVFRG